jgi:hypothetical protein
MFRFLTVALAALGGVLALSQGAHAQYIAGQRTNTTRVLSYNVPGPRGDITLPYLTNGISTFGVYNGVSPQVVGGPTLSDPVIPGVLPNYNLIYYGSAKGFSSLSVGATPAAPNRLRR